MTWPEVTDIKNPRYTFFVGSDDPIIFRKFHNFPWNIVAVARLESYFVVGSLNLTWWPDLTWLWVEIFTKVAEKMGVRWVKTRRRCAPPYFCYPRKTWGGGGGVQTPPAGRGLTNTTQINIQKRGGKQNRDRANKSPCTVRPMSDMATKSRKFDTILWACKRAYRHNITDIIHQRHNIPASYASWVP